MLDTEQKWYITALGAGLTVIMPIAQTVVVSLCPFSKAFALRVVKITNLIVLCGWAMLASSIGEHGPFGSVILTLSILFYDLSNGALLLFGRSRAADAMIENYSEWQANWQPVVITSYIISSNRNWLAYTSR